MVHNKNNYENKILNNIIILKINNNLMWQTLAALVHRRNWTTQKSDTIIKWIFIQKNYEHSLYNTKLFNKKETNLCIFNYIF